MLSSHNSGQKGLLPALLCPASLPLFQQPLPGLHLRWAGPSPIPNPSSILILILVLACWLLSQPGPLCVGCSSSPLLSCRVMSQAVAPWLWSSCFLLCFLCALLTGENLTCVVRRQSIFSGQDGLLLALSSQGLPLAAAFELC